MVKRVMVSFPEEFLAEVDRVAEEEHRSRSEFLREAVRVYMDVKRSRRRPMEVPGVRRAVEIQDDLARAASDRGEDSTDDVRQWREARR